jgi:hypothetical protein
MGFFIFYEKLNWEPTDFSIVGFKNCQWLSATGNQYVIDYL